MAAQEQWVTPLPDPSTHHRQSTQHQMVKIAFGFISDSTPKMVNFPREALKPLETG